MLNNRGRDSKPELAVRRIVHAAGLRYRVSARPLAHIPRTADLVFRPSRVAVFIDGCFWHSCPVHASTPKSNTSYWTPKLERNMERDTETNQLLITAGWLPLRFWEHENAEMAAATVIRAVMDRR